MLNLSSSEKVKDAHSSLVALLAPALTNSVVQATEDALLLEEEVAIVRVTLFLMDANISVLVRTLTVKMKMVKIMQDFLNSKSMEEVLTANASLVL